MKVRLIVFSLVYLIAFSIADGPLVIKTNMLVRSMGPITESEMVRSPITC